SLLSSRPRAYRDLPSFPTRRSSDLFSTTTTMAGSTFISLTDRPLPPQKAQSPRPAPCSSTTITTAPSPTSPTKPACPMIAGVSRSEEHTSELQSRGHLVCRLLLEKK